MPTLPPDVRPYRRTPTFTEDTVPAALQRAHTTKGGVWARIVVESGRLTYRIRGGDGGTFALSPDLHGVVRPGEPHDVHPDGPVRFYVEFLSVDPDAGDPHG